MNLKEINDILAKKKSIGFDGSFIQNSFSENNLNGVIVFNAKGNIEHVNSVSLNKFKYKKDELKGKNIKLLFPDFIKIDKASNEIDLMQEHDFMIFGYDNGIDGKKKDGSITKIQIAISKIKINSKLYYSCILNDNFNIIKTDSTHISPSYEKVNEKMERLAEVVNKLIETNNELKKEIIERKETEKKLEASSKKLKRSYEKEKELAELKSRFVSMASHEFRTPLSLIQSSAAIIKHYITEEQQPNRVKHTDRIITAVKDLNDILNDFLSLARLEEGQIDNQPIEFNIKTLCNEVIEDMSAMLKQGQTITHICAANKTTIFLDKRWIKNIFMNLLSNAIKYSKEGKQITCEIEIYDDQLSISVIDEGIGIPQKAQKHLFTRFFRAGNVINIPGTGLGLNIIRNYLDLLNGEIHFSSEVGVGSTFKVTIPLFEKN